MPFDTTRWDEPATRSELADTCMSATLALRSIYLALRSLENADKTEFSKQLQDIHKHADELSGMFDQLAGYEAGETDSE